MKTSDSLTKVRLLQILLGGILIANLREDDWNSISSLIDADLMKDLRLALNELQFSMGKRAHGDLQPLRVDSIQPPIDEARDIIGMIYGCVRQKKLGRNRLAKYMQEINPRLPIAKLMTFKDSIDLIRFFVSRSALEESNRLLGRLRGKPDEDPYLRGITRR